MELYQIEQYFKTEYDWNESISVGKIDKGQSKAICFYHSNRILPAQSTVGGISNQSYRIMPISVLIRYGKDAQISAEIADEIYNWWNQKTFEIDDKRLFVIQVYNAPVALGTDEYGVYEYTIELNVIYEL